MTALSRKTKMFLASQAFRALALVRKARSKPVSTTEAPAGTIYSFTLKTIEGKDKSLGDYKGQVLMLVNTASKCGFTPQYDSLEALYQKYKDKGFRILGFPANEFGAQEPGSNDQIQEFCRMRFGVSFDLFAKIVVKGPGKHPLYEFLTTRSGHNGEIPWNFTKFLVSRDGRVAARLEPHDDPSSRSVEKRVESLLAA